jgi:hypothetical protein
LGTVTFTWYALAVKRWYSWDFNGVCALWLYADPPQVLVRRADSGFTAWRNLMKWFLIL